MHPDARAELRAFLRSLSQTELRRLEAHLERKVAASRPLDFELRARVEGMASILGRAIEALRAAGAPVEERRGLNRLRSELLDELR